jgi:hypothetical protein
MNASTPSTWVAPEVTSDCLATPPSGTCLMFGSPHGLWAFMFNFSKVRLDNSKYDVPSSQPSTLTDEVGAHESEEFP